MDPSKCRPAGGPIMTAVAPRPVVTRPYPVQRAAARCEVPAVPAHDGPEGPWRHVHRDLVHVVHDRRPDGAVHACRAGPAGNAVPHPGAVQPAVHHARHDHAAVLCHGRRVRFRQLRAAAADRRAGRGVPEAERFLLLAVLLRRDHLHVRLLHPERCRGLRLDGLHAAVPGGELAGCRWRPVDHGPGGVRPRHHPGRRQHDHHGDLHARPRHDDVAAADLHLGASWSPRC